MEEELVAATSSLAAPVAAVEGLHRAASCFYGLLSVLQGPLSTFVAARCAAVPLCPPEAAKEFKNVAKAGLKAKLQFISSHWDSHFSAVAPMSLVADLKVLVQVVNQTLYATNTSLTSYLKGIAAVERLLLVVEAGAEAMAEARMIRMTLCVDEIQDHVAANAPLPRESSLVEPPGLVVEPEHQEVKSPASSEAGECVHDNSDREEMETEAESEKTSFRAEGADLSPSEATASPDLRAILAIDSKPKRRKALFQHALHLATTKMGAHEDAISVLTLALALANSKQQRVKMLVYRMEWSLQRAQRDLACQDALDAKALIKVKKVELVKRLAGGFRAMGLWKDASEVYELGLSKHPQDKVLQLDQRFVLQKIATMSDTALHGSSSSDPSISESIQLQDEPELHDSSEIQYEGSLGSVALGPASLQSHTSQSSESCASDDCIFTTSSANSLAVRGLEAVASPEVAAGVDLDSSEREFAGTKVSSHKQQISKKHVMSSEKSRLAAQAKCVLQTIAFLDGTAKADAKCEAIRLVSAALALTSSNKQRCKMLTLRSECHLQCGDRELAYQDARAALMPVKIKKQPMLRLVNVFLALNRYREAVQAYDMALQRTPDNEELQQGKAIALEKAAEAEDGKEATRVPVKVALDTSKPKQSCGVMAPIKIVEWRSYFEKLLREGSAHVASNDHMAGNKTFTKALSWLSRTRDYKTDASIMNARVVALGHRARCRLEIQNFKTAARDALKGIVLQPDWIDGHRLLCRAWMSLGQLHDALTACKSVLRYAPQDIQFQQLLDELREKSGFRQEVPKPYTWTEAQGRVEDKAKVVPTSEKVSTDLPAAGITFDTVDGPEMITDVCLQSARDGSEVARRRVAAHEKLLSAKESLATGDIQLAFNACREALQLWPNLTIPRSVGDVLLLVDPHDAIARGGPMVYFTLQASTMPRVADNSAEERELWVERVKTYPNDVQLHIKLALELHKRKEIGGARDQVDKAFALLVEAKSTEPDRWKLLSTSALQYLRACCSPMKVTSSWSPGQQRQRSRQEELLKYVKQTSIDDEWMPHACYSLGMDWLLKRDYERAKQFHFLAQQAESRRMELQLFPAIDETGFLEKKILNQAFCGNLKALPITSQRDAIVSGTMGCGWCLAHAIPLEEYVQHKTRACSCLPTSPV